LGLLPPLSQTERIALETGSVGFEGELFTGDPDWNILLNYPKPQLTAEEQAFLDGPVEELCTMVNDWEITHVHADLPPELWAFIKKNKFFGMIIPKEYGGLGFSALAHHKVIQKLASVSSVVSSTVGVPNSLGPGELLVHYGTQEQKDQYLPRLADGREVPCFGLTGKQISEKDIELSPLEKEVADHLIEIMRSEDIQEYEEPYLDGWHYMLNQPEFAHSDQMSTLMELVEQRGLLKVIVPAKLSQPGVHVIIGKENKDKAIQNCSVVICRYGIPAEATGTIGVVGPTRMPYSRTIPTVYYLSSVLSELVAGLYGKEIHSE